MKIIINLLKNSKVKMVIILSFLLFIYITVCAFSYAQNISTDIANNVLDYMFLLIVIVKKIKI